METVRRAGLAELEPGQMLRARIAAGQKGPLAVALEADTGSAIWPGLKDKGFDDEAATGRCARPGDGDGTAAVGLGTGSGLAQEALVANRAAGRPIALTLTAQWATHIAIR